MKDIIIAPNKSIGRNTKTLLCLFCFFSFLLAFVYDEMFTSRIGVISLITLNIYMIWYSFKGRDVGLLFFYLFALLYSIVPLGYLFGGFQIAFLDYCQNPKIVNLVLRDLLLFHAILAYFVKPLKADRIVIPSYRNDFFFIVCLLFFIVCYTQGLTGNNIFEAGGYGGDIAKSKSTLFEYGIIPLSLMLIFSFDNKRLYLSYIAAFLFIFKSLIYGGRIEVIELTICILLVKLQNIWSIKKISLVIIVGAIFMATWGAYRTLDKGMSLVFSDENASEVYFSSMRIHYLIDKGILSFADRTEALIWYFIGTVIPQSMQPPLGNLQQYLKDVYPSGGGGLAMTYFYAYGGYLAVALLSLFVVKVFNKRSSKKPAMRIYSMFVVAMIPRWYAYYPVHLIKFCLIGTIIFIISIKYLNSRRIKNIPHYASNY